MNINNPTTFSPPDLTLSTSNSSGSAGALRADDTILVYDATVPDAITFGQSGAAGSAAVSARRDHAHAMAANPVVAIGTRSYNNANVSIPDASNTLLPMNSTQYDTDDMHDDTTNNNRITFTTAGYYVVNVQLLWASNTTGVRSHNVTLNAGASVCIYNWEAEALARYLTFSFQYHFDADDYITMYCYQNSGGSLNLTYEGVVAPYVSAFKIG